MAYKRDIFMILKFLSFMFLVCSPFSESFLQMFMILLSQLFLPFHGVDM